MRIRDYYGGILPRRQNQYKWWISAYFLISTSCIKFIYWPHTLSYLTRAYGLMATALFLFGRKAKTAVRRNYSVLVLTVTLFPFLSIYNSYAIYGQDPFISFLKTSQNLIFLLYFVLHHYRVGEAAILRSFLFYASATVVIQIVQQFTYPYACFGLESAKNIMLESGSMEAAEMRNGLWRFRVGLNGYFAVPIIFSTCMWLKKKYDCGLAWVFLILCVSIYLTLTRQVIFACVVTLFTAFFMGKMKPRNLALCVLSAAGLYFAYDSLLGELVEKTADETNEHNVRVLAATYFWEESTRSPLTFLLGYGEYYSGSRYGQLRGYLQDASGFYVGDVGFVGQIYTYGLLYVISSYLLMGRVFFHRSKLIPSYIRLFVIYCTIMSPMIFPFAGFAKGVWVMLFYICDLHIGNSPLALQTTKTKR